MFDDGVSALGIIGGIAGVVLGIIGLREMNIAMKIIGALALFVAGYFIGSYVDRNK